MRYGRHLVAVTLGTSLVFGGVTAGVGSLAPAVYAQDVSTGTAATVDVDFLNVRQTPSLSGAIVKTLAFGAAVDIAAGPVNADGYDWYRLEQDGAPIGWSVAGFLQAADGTVTTPVIDWQYGDTVVVDTDVLNVRAQPSLTGQVLDVYASGTRATVTGDATSADGIVWYPVDNLGWVAGQYLAGADGSGSGDGTDGGSAPADGWGYGAAVVVTTDLLNVRSTPSLSGTVLDVYEYGTQATVTGDATSADGITWYPVDNLGWVAGQYLGGGDGTSGSAPGDPAGGFGYGDVVVVSTDLLNVRSLPAQTADVLDVLPNGTQATITGDATDADGITWYPVDNTGWVAGQYLSLVTGAPDQPVTSAPATGSAPASSEPQTSDAPAASSSAPVSGTPAASGSARASDSASARSSAAPGASTAPGGSAAASASARPSTSPRSSASAAASASGSAASSAAPSGGANTEAFADGDLVAVDEARLNVRATASSTAEILRTVEAGTQFTINGDPVEVDGVIWYNVGTDTDQEWVIGEYLSAVVSAT